MTRARHAVARWFMSYVDWQKEWGRVFVGNDDKLGGEVLCVERVDARESRVVSSFDVKGWVEESGMPVVIRHLHGSESYLPRSE